MIEPVPKLVLKVNILKQLNISIDRRGWTMNDEYVFGGRPKKGWMACVKQD